MILQDTLFMKLRKHHPSYILDFFFKKIVRQKSSEKKKQKIIHPPKRKTPETWFFFPLYSGDTNKGLIAGLIKGNQWLIRVQKGLIYAEVQSLWHKLNCSLVKDLEQKHTGKHMPRYPRCTVYLSRFGMIWVVYGVNVGKYTNGPLNDPGIGEKTHGVGALGGKKVGHFLSETWRHDKP